MLGRFELITRLATGGMAEIMLARERGLAGLERFVVIKRILPHLAGDPAFVQMFLREARIQARLAHPNVVHIHELGEEGGTWFIVMEYIHGCTLREVQVLAHHASLPVPPAVTVAVVEGACRGAHAAHQLAGDDGALLGVVHRDISPHNLMITGDGHVKLLDFGIARGAEPSNLTRADGVRGKLGYMSPEQIEGEPPLDRRSDVFSLGIILWELLAGRPLFKRKSELDVMKAITETDAPPPSTFEPSVSPELDAVARRALERDRERRFPSAEAMRTALLEAARNLGVEPGSDDEVARFVAQVAGERLAERDAVLAHARERALSARERQSLLHASDSAIFEIADVMRRSGVPVPPTPPPEVAGEVSDEHLEPPGPSPRRVPIIAAAVVAVLVVVGVVVALLVSSSGSDDASPGEARAEASPDPVPGTTPSPPLQGPPVVIGWAPTIDREVLARELEPLRVYLQQALARPVTLELSQTYAELAEGVFAGRYAYGVFPPLLYVRAQEREPEALEPMAFKAFEGAVRSDGYLLVTRDSELERVEDLADKRFCLTDPDSASGNLLPRVWLRAQGLDPDAVLSAAHWSGDHLQVLRDLVSGQCEIAATSSGALLTASSLGVAAGRLRIFAITGHLPQEVVVAGPGAPSEERLAVQEALFGFDPQSHSESPRPWLGESQRISGFEPVDESLFESLRALVAAERAKTPR